MARHQKRTFGEILLAGGGRHEGVIVLVRDGNERVMICAGTTVPSAKAGFAKGCLFFKTDASNGVKALYENKGTTASCTFDVVGDIAAGEITLAEGNVLVGNASGVAAALSAKTDKAVLIGNGTTITANILSGDVTMGNNGVTAIGAGKVLNSMVAEDIVKIAKVTVSNAELLALRATPKTLVAAPGANKVIVLQDALLQHLYATAAFTITNAGDDMAIKYTDGAGVAISQTIQAQGLLDQAASTLSNALPKLDTLVASATAANQPIVLHNIGAAEWTVGGGTLEIYVRYRIVTIT